MKARVATLQSGAISGTATALVGMAGPPLLIYLLLAGAPPPTARATLLSFFGIVYAAALLSHTIAVGNRRRHLDRGGVS